MNHENKPIRKASTDPVKEALGHPNGPGLSEMINGQEEKTPKNKNKKPSDGEPDGGPIPVI
jgi:hypothetical protein